MFLHCNVPPLGRIVSDKSWLLNFKCKTCCTGKVRHHVFSQLSVLDRWLLENVRRMVKTEHIFTFAFTNDRSIASAKALDIQDYEENLAYGSRHKTRFHASCRLVREDQILSQRTKTTETEEIRGVECVRLSCWKNYYPPSVGAPNSSKTRTKSVTGYVFRLTATGV